MADASAALIACDRRAPIGAEVHDAQVSLRVWAPCARTLTVVSPDGPPEAMTSDEDGYFAVRSSHLRTGSLYGFSVDGRAPLPDPASRFQPSGPEGWSEVVDPAAFTWSDAGWSGPARRGLVVYELHVGTFTPEGTFAAAARRLGHLADVGITVVELMPIADFPGAFGWGYDGVSLWAPTRLYGRPDDLRAFVDRAHALGIAVILDVVYNHVGPSGSVLERFSPDYFTDRYDNEWGRAINFDGPASGPVREFFVENAVYWVREFHLDGLRLDATQQIFDRSRRHVVQEIATRTRRAAAPRRLFLIAENEPQQARLARPVERGGYGLDALWNDDFHHAAVVAATGHAEAYYSDTRGTPQELISAVQWGFLYQGQRSQWQNGARGSPALDLPATAFVGYLENHDQVANSARGTRLVASTTPGRLRALTALLLLAPATPLLFQGQEFGSTAPFLYFADLPDLGDTIARGRREFLAQFPSIAAVARATAVPGAADTFARSRLDWQERDRHASLVALHRDLLRLRRTDPAFAQQRSDRVRGAVLEAEAFVLRFFHEAGDRLLVVNLGRDLVLAPAPEPLLAPPAGRRWRILWSSEDVAYGGGGNPRLEPETAWTLRGHAAMVLEGAAP